MGCMAIIPAAHFGMPILLPSVWHKPAGLQRTRTGVSPTTTLPLHGGWQGSPGFASCAVVPRVLVGSLWATPLCVAAEDDPCIMPRPRDLLTTCGAPVITISYSPYHRSCWPLPLVCVPPVSPPHHTWHTAFTPTSRTGVDSHQCFIHRRFAVGLGPVLLCPCTPALQSRRRCIHSGKGVRGA